MARPFRQSKSSLIQRSWQHFIRRFFPSNQNFQVLKTKIVTARPAPNEEYSKGLVAKIGSLRPEFVGSSELCFLHATTIVKIRRGIWLKNNLEIFFKMWAEESEHLCEGLNSRWLLSALDTFADYGTPVERPTALMVAAFFNAIRIAESERCGAPNAPSVIEQLPPTWQPLWDGIVSYNFRDGDMLLNMIERMRLVIHEHKSLSLIMETMIDRSLKSDNVFSRAVQANVKKEFRESMG